MIELPPIYRNSTWEKTLKAIQSLPTTDEAFAKTLEEIRALPEQKYRK